VHEGRNGFISPSIYELLYCYLLKKWTLEMLLAVSFYRFST
jgi:hypothetical protein